ncbi:S1C family serine protease [Halorhabdus amylolytica]|uniref:S1C family serine protease n=1 Tax=Halorhabdus amylolytica TaxID=2559573 RepID=UPI0010AA6428|nr:trypsin-like peptidase domain-containing protein [Halorhabdus amylolytica]
MSEETTTRRRFLHLGGIALSAGLAGCDTALSAPDSNASRTSSASDSSAGTGRSSSTDARSQADGSVYTRVYRDTIPSVVLVRTDRGQGTGFLYDDTHVVTNAHVVSDTSSVQLRFQEGTWREGAVRGTDVHADLAVVVADSVPGSAEPLPLVREAPVIGQEVVAIGNPYNLDGSLTSGIISGLDRLIPSPSGYRIPDAIQTDAAVNPGNSGGPLMSLSGQVVGVVNSKQGDNIAFGISAALAERVVPELIESGEYEHAYMGVTLENVTPAIARANDMSDPRGLLIVRAVRGGPADGVLQPSDIEFVNGSRLPVGGDVILSVDGVEMTSFEDLASYLALQTRPGDTIQVRILRDGSEQTVEMKLIARPERSRSPLQ